MNTIKECDCCSFLKKSTYFNLACVSASVKLRKSGVCKKTRGKKRRKNWSKKSHWPSDIVQLQTSVMDCMYVQYGRQRHKLLCPQFCIPTYFPPPVSPPPPPLPPLLPPPPLFCSCRTKRKSRQGQEYISPGYPPLPFPSTQFRAPLTGSTTKDKERTKLSSQRTERHLVV